ncbi:MAG: cytochrome c family protein [Nitrospirota bacterium]
MSDLLQYSAKKVTAAMVFFFAVVVMTNMPLYSAETRKVPLYVGSDRCKKCHEKEYNSFMQYAKKSRSYNSIERVKKGLTQEEIRGCYVCHTTGYGKPGGFVSLEKTPHLKNTGCEACHGPAEFHVKTSDPDYIKRKMTLNDCEICHISERVKAFNYKPLIHGGAH